jgi:valyl-tRNA synthetase
MLEKRFNFLETEKDCLDFWSKKNIFSFSEKSMKDPFCIMMPPPNVTGSLHMGHALTFTLQDILIRFQKKLGKNVLWQPGIDHAGIATEIIVEKMIIKKFNKDKNEFGREKFIKEIWNWKEKSGDKIVNQLKKLGTSVDWNISKFTMDRGLTDSVNEAFINLFNKGLIYKDKRLVNWDPILETAVSDLEVNQQESLGKLWFIRYQIDQSQEDVIVATTRPETIFGDTALAIHPKNKRLKRLIGKHVIVPIIKKKIPVISDIYADPAKGSGVVKITPAHDFNDFEVGKRHKLEFVNIFDKKARLNKNTPKEYHGLDRFEARKKVISQLIKTEKIEQTVDNKMAIPIGDRSGAIIEPYLTDQWFLNTQEMCISVKKSIKDNKIKFHPNSWMNTFKHWINNIEPWCISRQIWWGHRIPIWYTNSDIIIAAKSKKDAQKLLESRSKNVKITYQETDVLDTWFSSALWPFSTLGWPKNDNLLSKYYPTDVLVTGFDIIFFWVARMIMMGLKFMNEIPFKNIYIHPLVKDERGNKMSKSKGNVIDPLELIKLYGADALRFTLANLSTQGRDIRLSNKLVENSRNFITKIWNVARFSQFNEFRTDSSFSPKLNKLSLNKWIFYRYTETQNKVLKNLESFKFNLVISELYHFIWNDFCDLYIELSKNYLKDEEMKKEISGNFNYIFKNSLNLINPIIPFITEKIAKELGYIKNSFFDELIDRDVKFNHNKDIIIEFTKFIDLIKKIRIELNGEKPEKFKFFINSKKKIRWIDANLFLLNSIFKFIKIEYALNSSGNDNNVLVVSGVRFLLESQKNDIVDDESLRRKINHYQSEIEHFKKRLSNKNFLEKAPSKLVELEKRKFEDAKKNLKLLIKE